MTNPKEDHPESSFFRSSSSGPDSADNEGRREPGFGSFRDSALEEYEEPERDTDYFSGYNAEEGDEEEEQDDLFPSWDGEQSPAPPSGANPAPGPEDSGPTVDDEPAEPVEWHEDEEYFEPEEVHESPMPLRLIAIGGFALLLLVIGAYGVLQERAAMQKELRELRASLATGVKASDVREARDALRELQQSYDSLAAEASALSQENLELKEVITALERAQAGADAEPQAPVTESPAQSPTPAPAVARQDAPPPAPIITKTPVPERTAPPPAASAPAGPWFVNFGSYTSRETAQSWASKLSPVQGEVVVMPGTKDNRTYYRVRVVGLSGKKAADLVARQLEAELQVSRLWVGQE
jgi:cell division septation protein DedD